MRFVKHLAITLMAMTASGLSRPFKDTPFTNPILGGWHSDPSCIYVADHDTTFCVTSTFIAFPGLPVYATKDLQNWKHISNVFNRPSQIPSLAQTVGQQGGIYAPTLRYHDGKFYLIVTFLGPTDLGLVFTSTDPFHDDAWSEPLQFDARGIDPDIFWDDDGTVYVTSSDNGIKMYSLDLETGATGPVSTLWNGTGGVYPEGPHLYRKDGYYYLMIAEGGTELNHAETMARSKHRTGPWEPCPSNPLLSNRNTTQYFQTVGHADLFQDGHGNWWAAALSTRSGPEWENYPMGRETVLVPATWEEGKWPVLQPVRGEMRGPLPRADRASLERKGRGAWAGDPDAVDFTPGSTLPLHFLYWRFPKPDTYTVSPRGHPNTLRVKPSFYNLTGGADFQPSDGTSLIMRTQTDTLFTYGVDVTFRPEKADEEAGVTLFLTQDQHVDLGIVLLQKDDDDSADPVLSLRFRPTGRGNFQGPLETQVVAVPEDWTRGPIRLEIQAVSDSTYTFSAAPARSHERRVIGSVDSLVVSGDTGRFTGTLVGAYATSNGGEGSTAAYFGKWRYKGQGQKVDHDVIVPSRD